MTTFADQCTRVYSPNGAKAHLAAPGTRQPLCPARGRPPKDGWKGTLDAKERAWADALETCQHCARLAAARDTQTPPPAHPEDLAPEPVSGAAVAPRSIALSGSGGPAAERAPAGLDWPDVAIEPLPPLPPRDDLGRPSRPWWRRILARRT